MPKFIIYSNDVNIAIGHCVVESVANIKARDGIIYIPTDDDYIDINDPKWSALAARYTELWPHLSEHFCLDPAAALTRAKTARKALIKTEAADWISSLDWKLQRAKERETAGWATLADVDAVLTERESIRRSSGAAELALEALTDVASVQSFTWAVDLLVIAPRRLTHKQFIGLFTDKELEDILAASLASKAMGAWWKKFELSDGVDRNDPDLWKGLQALEFAGFISQGRAAEVLS